MGESNGQVSNVERSLSLHRARGLMESKPGGRESSKEAATLIQVGG